MDRIKKVQDGLWSLRGSFDDVDDLVETTRAWNVDFRQIEPGRFRGHVGQVAVDGVLLSLASFSRGLDQYGDPPPVMHTFAVPMSSTTRYHWRGHEIHGGQIAVFPFGGELRAVTRPGFHMATISLTSESLERAVQRTGVRRVPSRTEVVTPCANAMEGLRSLIRETDGSTSRERLAEALPEALVAALAGPVDRSGPPSVRRRDRALARVDEYLSSVPQEPVSVRDLCRVAGVSHRTLAYAFRERYGITAKAWLRDRRLTGARRELRRADPGSTKVADVANDWGFWHLGQFAADYRRMFCELPSETLAR